MTKLKTAAKRPRLLIENWLPAAAIGVECIRERSTGQQPPDKRLHVWWARRPLVVSRAAVLASVLPSDFPRDAFERLLGFGRRSEQLVAIRAAMDMGVRVPGGFNSARAFKKGLKSEDLVLAHAAARKLFGDNVRVMDTMAGGGSIPLEAARMGFETFANEYNPVACSILEATLDYPLRFGAALGAKARSWAKVWIERVSQRLGEYYPAHKYANVHAYIFARTVPCPHTEGNPDTPLVPDWHLHKPKSGTRVVAQPRVDKKSGSWTVRIRSVGENAGEISSPPQPTYSDGKGISVFANLQIPSDYIKAQAQSGHMRNALYAVALKTPQGLEFRAVDAMDLEAVKAATTALKRLRAGWEKLGLLPNETIPLGDKTGEVLVRGIRSWSDMFSPRQLLCFGVLSEELHRLRPSICRDEGSDRGEAILHLLAFALDKFANYNSVLASWHAPHSVVRSVFDRHDYSFKPTFAEMAPCGAGAGLSWAVDNTISAYEAISKLPRSSSASIPELSQGTATNLPQIPDRSIAAIVVDPPYADNVQYSELANFFYVWLKRAQGHRRHEWFSTYLCGDDQEAVVNLTRHRKDDEKTAITKQRAQVFYQTLMRDVFLESHRKLRDDGVLTVMFTHKKQEAWQALFTSLIQAGFTVTATWPVKTESEHSLHQAKKNAAQSTVILVTRKRQEGAGIGYFDSAMQEEIRQKARTAAERLKSEGLNPVDQLVGSFGPAMEVYSRYDEVRTDTGESVDVGHAIDEASDAVSAWRIEQLAARGLDGVEPEGRFALLCWDVLGAAEFRFNEARLIGHAVGMDVERLVIAGLVTKSGDKIVMVPAKERRRERPLEPDEVAETLFGPVLVPAKRTKKQILKIHPNDPQFRTAIDACDALALRYIEAGGGTSGIGSARALARQQRWAKDSAVAKLMQALVEAAPEGLRRERGAKSAAVKYPEFRAWHALLKPLFEIEPADWTEKVPSIKFPLLADQENELGEAEDQDLEQEEEDEEQDEEE